MPSPTSGAERDMIRISQLAASVKPSATLAAGAKARQLKAAGVKVFDFSLGEPDFNTPETHLRRRGRKPRSAGQTHYTPDERHGRGQGRDLPVVQDVPRPRLRAGERDRFQRREALDPQRARGHGRARRRGHHPDAVLGELLRPREHDRRDAGARDRRRSRAASRCRRRNSRPRSRRRRAC